MIPRNLHNNKKMKMAYCIAKNNLPFANFGPLLTLLKKEGNLDSGKTSVELTAWMHFGKNFMDIYGKLLLRGILKNLSANNF